MYKHNSCSDKPSDTWEKMNIMSLHVCLVQWPWGGGTNFKEGFGGEQLE